MTREEAEKIEDALCSGNRVVGIWEDGSSGRDRGPEI